MLNAITHQRAFRSVSRQSVRMGIPIVDDGDLTLRPGVPEDGPGIIALITRENHRQTDPDRVRRRLAQLPSVVVEREGDVMGFIYARRFSPDMVELSNMLIDSRLRRRGVGSRMVTMLEPELGRLGYRGAVFVNCRLHIGASDQRSAAARAFWLRRGYRIVFATHGSVVFVKSLERPVDGTGAADPDRF
jgi:GNAT superfamily N-acetyltransferase